MKKDFKRWHERKSHIDGIIQRPFFHEREIWFCHIGANVGSEQDGVGEDFQRPVLVVRQFNNEICWVVPLSKTKKRGPYYFAFDFSSSVVSVALLSQIRLLDARRFSRKIGEIGIEEFAELKRKIRALLP